MLRPSDRLSEPTRHGLDAAVRGGAQETWVDRSELGLSEPSAVWRWLCVLELTAPGASAVGCSDDDSEHGVELAAREALARFDQIVRGHRADGRGPAAHNRPAFESAFASLEPPTDPDLMSDLFVGATRGSETVASSHARQRPCEDHLGHLRAVGAASTAPSLEMMRRHVTDLCIWNEIVPVVGAPCEPRARPGTPEVALQYVGGLDGYWGCLHDIGLAIADAAWGAVECELRAWSWAYQVALIGPGADVLDLAVAAVFAELAMDVSAVAPEPMASSATHLAAF
jgi:hypothetical protein